MSPTDSFPTYPWSSFTTAGPSHQQLHGPELPPGAPVVAPPGGPTPTDDTMAPRGDGDGAAAATTALLALTRPGTSSTHPVVIESSFLFEHTMSGTARLLCLALNNIGTGAWFDLSGHRDALAAATAALRSLIVSSRHIEQSAGTTSERVRQVANDIRRLVAALAVNERLLLPLQIDTDRQTIVGIMRTDAERACVEVWLGDEDARLCAVALDAQSGKSRRQVALRYEKIVLAETLVPAANSPAEAWLHQFVSLLLVPSAAGASAGAALVENLLPKSGGEPATVVVDAASFRSLGTADARLEKAFMAVLKSILPAEIYKAVKFEIHCELMRAWLAHLQQERRERVPAESVYRLSRQLQNLQRANQKLRNTAHAPARRRNEASFVRWSSGISDALAAMAPPPHAPVGAPIVWPRWLQWPDLYTDTSARFRSQPRSATRSASARPDFGDAPRGVEPRGIAAAALSVLVPVDRFAGALMAVDEVARRPIHEQLRLLVDTLAAHKSAPRTHATLRRWVDAVVRGWPLPGAATDADQFWPTAPRFSDITVISAAERARVVRLSENLATLHVHYRELERSSSVAGDLGCAVTRLTIFAAVEALMFAQLGFHGAVASGSAKDIADYLAISTREVAEPLAKRVKALWRWHVTRQQRARGEASRDGLQGVMGNIHRQVADIEPVTAVTWAVYRALLREPGTRQQLELYFERCRGASASSFGRRATSVGELDDSDRRLALRFFIEGRNQGYLLRGYARCFGAYQLLCQQWRENAVPTNTLGLLEGTAAGGVRGRSQRSEFTHENRLHLAHWLPPISIFRSDEFPPRSDSRLRDTPPNYGGEQLFDPGIIPWLVNLEFPFSRPFARSGEPTEDTPLQEKELGFLRHVVLNRPSLRAAAIIAHLQQNIEKLRRLEYREGLEMALMARAGEHHRNPTALAGVDPIDPWIDLPDAPVEPLASLLRDAMMRFGDQPGGAAALAHLARLSSQLPARAQTLLAQHADCDVQRLLRRHPGNAEHATLKERACLARACLVLWDTQAALTPARVEEYLRLTIVASLVHLHGSYLDLKAEQRAREVMALMYPKLRACCEAIAALPETQRTEAEAVLVRTHRFVTHTAQQWLDGETPPVGVMPSSEDVQFDPLTGRCWLGEHRVLFGVGGDLLGWLRSHNIVDPHAQVTGQQGWVTFVGDDCKATWSPRLQAAARVWKRYTVDGTASWFEKVPVEDVPAALTTVLWSLRNRADHVFYDALQPADGRAYIVFDGDVDGAVVRATMAADGTMAVFRCPQPGQVLQLVAPVALPSALSAHDHVVAWRDDARITRFTFVDSQHSFIVDEDDQARWSGDLSLYIERISPEFLGRSGSLCILENDFGQRRGLLRIDIDTDNRRNRYRMLVEIDGQGALLATRGDEQLALAVAYLQENDYGEALTHARRAAHALHWDFGSAVMSDLMEESLRRGRTLGPEQMAIEASIAVALTTLDQEAACALVALPVAALQRARGTTRLFDDLVWMQSSEFFCAVAASYIEGRHNVPKALRLTPLEELRLFRRAEAPLAAFLLGWGKVETKASRDLESTSRQSILALAATNRRRHAQLKLELQRLQGVVPRAEVTPAPVSYGDPVAWISWLSTLSEDDVASMMTLGVSDSDIASLSAAAWPIDHPYSFLRYRFQALLQQLTAPSSASVSQLVRKLELYDCQQSREAACLRKILLSAARHPVAARALLAEDGTGVALVTHARWLRREGPDALRAWWQGGNTAPARSAAGPARRTNHTLFYHPSPRARSIRSTLIWFAYWYCYRPNVLNRREQLRPHTIVAGPLPHAEPVSLFAPHPPVTLRSCTQASMLADAVAAHPARVVSPPRIDWQAGHSADPVVQEQRAGIAERIERYTQSNPGRRHIDRREMDALRDCMQALAATEALDRSEGELLALANIEDDDVELRAQHRNDRNATLTRAISLPHLLRAYALDHLAILADDNPALKAPQLRILAERTRQFLLHKTRQQQAARVLETLERTRRAAAAKDSDVEQSLRELAYEQLAAVRHYDPAVAPALLVFEAHNSILLTAAQVDVLETFTARGEDGWQNHVVQQLEMGGGKTRVLMPLLLFLLARGESIPFALVPSELYAVNAQDLQRTSEATFGQAPYCFSFSRATKLSRTVLERILENMQDVARDGGYVVTTKESIQSFRLQYLDMLQDASERYSYALHLAHKTVDEVLARYDVRTSTPETETEAETDAQVRLMAEILGLWQQRGICLLDEVDTLLNVRNEFNFNLGQSRCLEGGAINVVKELYRVLSCDPWVRAQVDLRRNQQHRLSAEQTREILVRCSGPLLAAVLPHTEALPAADRDFLREYLTNVTAQLPDVADLRRRIGAAHGGADRLVVLREQLLTLLPATLRRHGGEHYGVPASQPLGFAIPYVKGRPVWGAHFGNVLETANYTYQWYMAEGVSPAAVRQLAQKRVAALVKERLGRQQDARQWAESMRWERLVAGSVWQDRSLSECDLQNSEAIDEISRLISGDFDRVSIVLEAYVLPQIPLYVKNASSNGFDLVDTFRVCQGFSGTTWNASTYHAKLTSKPSNVTDGVTFGAFLQADKTTSFCSQATDVGALLREQVRRARQRDVRAVIDVGGTFLHLAPIDIARQILTFLQEEHIEDVRHVLFFDPNTGNLCAWERTQAEPKVLTGSSAATLQLAGIAPAHSFAYFDQAHSIGADLPLSPTAKAVLTIGPLTNLRDVQQGAMRMRQLARGQSLCLALSPDFSAAYRGADVASASIEQILDHCIAQQAAMLSHDKERAFAVGLWNEAFRCALQATQAEQGGVRDAVAASFLPLLIQRVGLPTFEGNALSCRDDTMQVFQQQAARLASVIEACVNDLPVYLRQRAGAPLRRLAISMRSPDFVERMSRQLGALPLTARHIAGEKAASGQQARSDVQAQTQQEVEVEVEVVRDTFSRQRIDPGTWTDAHHIARPNGLPDGRPLPTTTLGWALHVARRAVSKVGQNAIDWGIFFIDLVKNTGAVIRAAYHYGKDPSALKEAINALTPYVKSIAMQSVVHQWPWDRRPAFRVVAANRDFDRPLFSENIYVSDNFRRTLKRQTGLSQSPTKPVMFFLAIQHADADDDNLTFVAVATEEAETFRSRRDTGLAPWAKRMSLYDAQGQLVTPGPRPIAGNAAQMDRLRRAVVELKGMSSKSEQTLQVGADELVLFRAWLRDGDEDTRLARRIYLFGEAARDDVMFADLDP